jgi:hypothetical protein
MPANAFIDKPKQPTDAEIAAALGSAKATWDQLLGALSALNAAPKYPEGSGVRLLVKSSRDIGPLMKLAEIKLAN